MMLLALVCGIAAIAVLLEATTRLLRTPLPLPARRRH